MKRKLGAIAIGLVVMVGALLLTFPLGCYESDGGPIKVGRETGECPGQVTRIGLEWPNGPMGLVLSPLLSLTVGAFAGVYAWRRLVPDDRGERLRL